MSSASQATVRVLCVDDDPESLARLVDALAAASDRIAVESAASAEDALDRLAAVDCLVSDYRMAGPEGLSFLTAARDERPDLPSVVFTDDKAADAAGEAISAGATDFLRRAGGRERATLLADRVETAVDRVRGAAGHHTAHDHERQYRELFEDAPVLFVTTRETAAGPVIESCNRLFAATLGYDRDALVGERLATVYDDSSAARLLDDGGYDRALSGEFVREPRTLVAQDGRRVETVLRASPRRSAAGDIVGTHAMFVDVTDETYLQALERQNERLDRFASVVSHDLRNPLNVATGHLSLAREDGATDDRLAAVARALDRMDDLIDDLLVLARQGDRATDTTAVDLADLAAECWAVDVGDTAGATLDVTATETVLADRSRLRQLLANLLSNAVEHGAAGDDPLRVVVGDLPDGFFVSDDGPGVAPADRERVFESGHTTSDDGTGFGLSIVREIAEAHGWTVRAAESESGGARFEVTGVERAS